MPQWNWNDPTIQLAPKRAMENIEPIAGGLVNRPSPMAIAVFLRAIRMLNGDQEPDPEGQLGEVWRWLKGLTV